MTATIEHQSWRGDPAPGYLEPPGQKALLGPERELVHRKVPDLAQYTPTEVLEAVDHYLELHQNHAKPFIAYLHQGWFGDPR